MSRVREIAPSPAWFKCGEQRLNHAYPVAPMIDVVDKTGNVVYTASLEYG